MGVLTPQPAFSLLDIVNDGAIVGTAPTIDRRGAGAGEGQLLAAIALEGYLGWMPLVGPAEWAFLDLVVPFDAHGNIGHSTCSSPPPNAPVKACESSNDVADVSNSTTRHVLGSRRVCILRPGVSAL